MTLRSVSPAAPPRSRSMRVAMVLWPAGKWVLYSALLFPYTLLRGLGDDFLPWLDVDRLESAAFLGEAPTRRLQGALYGHEWLDTAAFGLHISWFAIPVVLGLAVMRWERRRFLEFLCWVLFAGY